MHTTDVSHSPVSLSYIAALKGFVPRRPGEAFVYAQANCLAPEMLMALAASNPEGRFYGFMSDSDLCAKATRKAAERRVDNVAFLGMKLSSLLAGEVALPALDYLVCDESVQPLTLAERAMVFDVAAHHLKPNGLFNYNYRAYGEAGEALRFLVREFAPEMNPAEASDFLLEIKKLGHLYFKTQPGLAAKLDLAIARNMPDEFFALFEGEAPRSASFDTIVALRPRALVYAGDAQMAFNYIELTIPAEGQAIVDSCRSNPLYESIKDFAALNPVRSDIWCKMPFKTSGNPAELYGCFSYGITLPADKIPMSVDVFGKSVDLSNPLYRRVIDLISLQPATIGDFLQQPGNQDENPEELVGIIQILVALGLARPMRGALEAGNLTSLAQPRFAGSFNQFIDTLSVMGDPVAMASPVLGDVVRVVPRDALVMQALNRAGLVNSVSALLPELERIAKDPVSSARVIDIGKPTEENAYAMINDVVSHSIVQWYAYGLLEAA